MKIIVTGGCGYKGSVLVPKLLAAGHAVRVIDTQWFGRNLAEHPALEVVQGDIRTLRPVEGCEAVIHLAGIANDPCGELDAKLTWEVNVLATMRLAADAVAAGVRQFVFASSASVYGIQEGRPVTEDSPMEPVSDYNKTKMVAERVLESYHEWWDMPHVTLQIVRPATVCGVSPRMRLDTVVNMLTVQALTQRRIKAHCGAHGAKLCRPNVHIEDVTDLYCWLIEHPGITGTFNAGFENLTVGEIAEAIAAEVPATIEYTQVKDKRSYAVSSEQLLAAGFAPKHCVKDAVREIAAAWVANKVRDTDRSYNLRWMQKHGLLAA
jgi:nucleoside-diphosphate-sugar epimerase